MRNFERFGFEAVGLGAIVTEKLSGVWIGHAMDSAVGRKKGKL